MAKSKMIGVDLAKSVFQLHGASMTGEVQTFAQDQQIGRTLMKKFRLFQGSNISHAGEHNKKLVLQAIRAKGPVSRKDVSALLDLTVPSVFKITNELAASGLIIPSTRTLGERGKPSTSWVINPEGAFSLGLNVDRDHLTLVLLDYTGVVRARYHEEIPFADAVTTKAYVEKWIGDLQKKELVKTAKIVGFGVSIPDDLDTTRLPGQPDAYSNWSEVPIKRLVEDLLPIPVCIENDAAAAAIGEMHFGGGLKSDSFFYVLISAGLGGGLVINRHYFRGAHGRSGEIGFLPQIHPFRNRMTQLDKTVGDAVLLSDLYDLLKKEGFKASCPAHLVTLSRAGDACVDKWISSVADYLYLPLLNTVYAIDPDCIYIGGRLPGSIIDRLCTELSKRLSLNLGTNWPERVVRPAKLAVDASAVGAAVQAFQLFCNQTYTP